MRNTIISIIILFIAVIIAAGLYFSNLSSDDRQNSRALSRIPADASFVAGFRYDDSFREIFQNYKPFLAAIGDKKASEIRLIQKFFLSSPELSQAAEGQYIFLSFHLGKENVDFLWSVSLDEKFLKEDLPGRLSDPETGITVKAAAENADLYEIHFKAQDKPFFLCLNKSAVWGSFSKALLSKVTDPDAPKISREFIAEINNANSRNTSSPLNLYINHTSLPNFASGYLKRRINGNFQLLKNLKGFSTLTMNFKSDAVMFNGISETENSNAYLNLFLSQQPVANSIKKIMPRHTANFLAFGISDYTVFSSGLQNLLKRRGELERLEKQLKLIQSKEGTDIKRDLYPLLGKEFGVLQVSNGEKTALIQLKDSSKFKTVMEPISSTAADTVRRFDNSNILYFLLGDPMKEFTRPYYLIKDNYLIAGNSLSALRSFLRDYNDAKFLVKEQGFIEFNQLIANQSNILFFTHIENSKRIVRGALKPAYAEAFQAKKGGLSDFYGFSFQWSAEGGHFFTNFCANYTASETALLEKKWKFKMNGRIAINPQILDGTSGKPFIIVQDNINNIYGLSLEGEKYWARQIDGDILGEIRQLDDNSLIFNTSDKLYRTTTLGNDFPGFPIKLPKKASYGLTINSSNPDELKIFIPAGNSLLGYDSFGKVLDGWNKELDGNILFDIKTATLSDTHYVIAGTEKGSFYFFNHNGGLIFKLQDNQKHRFNNPIFLEVKNGPDDSRIITTDTTGTVRSFYFNGKSQQKNISSWSPNHFFASANITSNPEKELIFLDQTQLYVYHADSSLAYNFEFSYPIKQRQILFKNGPASWQLGIASAENGLLYLFKEDGTLVPGFPFKGEPYFYVGDMKNDGTKYLLSGSKDGYIYAYKL